MNLRRAVGPTRSGWRLDGIKPIQFFWGDVRPGGEKRFEYRRALFSLIGYLICRLLCATRALMIAPTVNLGVVGATVEENPHGLRAAVVHRVAVNLGVVATLRGDDACKERVFRRSA